MGNATIVFLAALFLGAALPAAAQNVKITPLGSHDGELCPFDRELIFEDRTARESSTTSGARYAAGAIRGWAG